MTNPVRKFSWERFHAALKSFWRQAPGEVAEEPLHGFKPDHLPYIEVMLPVTGVVTPINFRRKRTNKNISPGRLR